MGGEVAGTHVHGCRYEFYVYWVWVLDGYYGINGQGMG